jgi:DNA mismatch repair protein MutS2
MGLRCDDATLERLEWPRLAQLLAREAATERGAAACRAWLFAETRQGARERLAETSEARALVDAAEGPPFGGIADLRPLLAALARDALLAAADFAKVLGVLEGARRLRSFLRARAERAPRLAALAALIPDLGRLETQLARVVTPAGEIRDDASAELKRARRLERECERGIERKMSACLRDPAIVPHLQDHYTTSREGRPVLPVRSEARRQVPGIVHDVSASGTTVFVEPEGVVELANQLRLARLQVEREAERLLLELGESVRGEALDLEAAGDVLETLDVAQARGRLSARLAAVEPDVSEGARLELRGLRHPLLLLEGGLAPADVVPNDAAFPGAARAMVLSGPNAGGKTVFAKAIGLAALAVRAGLHVPCDAGSRVPIQDRVSADIGDEQDLRSGLSTFSARMSNLSRIAAEADDRTLVILDEIGEGTEPGEGAALAQAVLENLVERGALVVATTHFNRLKELAGSDERFLNASAEFDAETLLPTYRIHLGVPGSSGAMWVAERMGLERAVVDRARAVLDQDDRRLEALTRGLSELRQELERERRDAAQMARETQSVRAEYEVRLAKLRAAREKALAAMSADLETAFRDAREEIAAVVRSLQRGEPDGRAANVARQRLDEIRRRTERVEHAERGPSEPSPAVSIDWDALEPGAELVLEGIASAATLLEPPDARGRLAVRVGGARMWVSKSRVRDARGARSRPAPRAPAGVERGGESEAPSECDLRGLRVDEALERADAHLHRVLGSGRPSITFIHGHGTGALRSAIRAWLRQAPGVSDFGPGEPNAGGNGVTVVRLAY